MPYRVSGKNVWHYKDGKWSIKQRCKSAKNAHKVAAMLHRLEMEEEGKSATHD